MQKTRLVLIMVPVSMLLFGAPARTQTVGTCIQQARATYTDCRGQCKADFADARFACKNVNPQCGVACLAGRQVCFDAVDAILATGQLPDGSTLANCSGGTDACKATFDQAKAACGAPCQPADTVCHDCVDTAQVTDFECRDTCRDSWRTNPTVIAMKQACRASFKACVTACPPASAPQ